MEQLAAYYASSGEEEALEFTRQGDSSKATPASPHTGQPSFHEAVPSDAVPAATRTPSREAAARAALAQRFAQRARAATHRATVEERAFAYKPYQARKAGRAIGTVRGPTAVDTQRTRALPPLFSNLRALAAPHGAFHLSAADGHSTQASVVPTWQKHRRMVGHTGAISCLQWNPRYPPLFLSASMDTTIRVWSLPREYYEDDPSSRSEDELQLCRRTLSQHTHGVKSAKWSTDGRHMWSGGYDRQAVYVDVEKAEAVQSYEHHTDEHVTCVTPHPLDPQLALIGTDQGRVLQRDLRVDPSSPPSAVYGTKTTGEIHDLLFLPNDQGSNTRFISSSTLTARDTSHQTLLVWDFRSSALLADHINNDVCSFTSLQLHPSHKQFAAQSTSSEIVLFSASAPYKKLKPRRSYRAGHDAQGFSVGFGFNASGNLLATGDVHGRVVLYDTETRRVLKQHHVYDDRTPCLAVAFHPQWASTLLSGGADGRIELFDSPTSVPSPA